MNGPVTWFAYLSLCLSAYGSLAVGLSLGLYLSVRNCLSLLVLCLFLFVSLSIFICLCPFVWLSIGPCLSVCVDPSLGVVVGLIICIRFFLDINLLLWLLVVYI